MNELGAPEVPAARGSRVEDGDSRAGRRGVGGQASVGGDEHPVAFEALEDGAIARSRQPELRERPRRTAPAPQLGRDPWGPGEEPPATDRRTTVEALWVDLDVGEAGNRARRPAAPLEQSTHRS